MIIIFSKSKYPVYIYKIYQLIQKIWKKIKKILNHQNLCFKDLNSKL